jgi:creatinine amidohydrolase/Fe(II)-dependent formamide hydrolase-like protein
MRLSRRSGPTISYRFYPAFVDYPGAPPCGSKPRDLVVDICRSLARFGPPRFYILNTGVSTVRPLEAAVAELAKDGITLRYNRGTHAEEIETSKMLYIAPESVNMKLAAKDFPKTVHTGGKTGRRGLSPRRNLWRPHAAKRDKGEKIVKTPSGVFTNIVTRVVTLTGLAGNGADSRRLDAAG